MAFFSVTLFHNNPTSSPSMAENARSEAMKDTSAKFFQQVVGASMAGFTELREVRKKFAELVSQDNLRLVAVGSYCHWFILLHNATCNLLVYP